MRAKFISVFILFLLLFTNSWAQPNQWYSKNSTQNVKIFVDLFLSSTCPHCHKADEFFKQIEPKYPWLAVRRHIINQDKPALELFQQYLEAQQARDFAVPSIFFCNSRWIGFKDAESSGKNLLQGLNYCHQQIMKTGQLGAPTTKLLQQWASASWMGSAMKPETSARSVLPVVALTDAFNPCALFTLLAFFSFLVLQPGVARQIGLAFMFLLVLGAVHYGQQVHPNFYNTEFMPWLRIPAIVLGIALLAYVYSHLRQSITNNFYVTLILLFFTALFIQSYQQTCSLNLSFVFEQWLASKNLTTFQQSSYELFYQLFYLIPYAILLFGCIYLFEHFIKKSPFLQRTAQVCLALMALLLIFYPVALVSFSLSLLVLVLALILGGLVRRFAGL